MIFEICFLQVFDIKFYVLIIIGDDIVDDVVKLMIREVVCGGFSEMVNE